MSDLSREKLVEFFDWTADKGMMKQGTARSLRSACRAVLAVMEEDEARDVSVADLSAVIQRYQNLNSLKVNPSTMQVYDQRVRHAVKEFVRFNQDKAGWKPTRPQRSRTALQSTTKRKRTRDSSENVDVPEPASTPSGFDASQITHRFPLRQDMIVTVSGIPFDVKRSEMSRLTAFLSNLVATPDEEEEAQLMLPPPAPETSE